MTRDEILSANPLEDYLRGRGFSLFPSGRNFVTNACPITHHRKFHRCVTIDTAQNLWHCNDCKQGDTVIGWVMFEEKIPDVEAMRKLGGGSNGANRPARS